MRNLIAVTLICLCSLTGLSAVAEDAWVVQIQAAQDAWVVQTQAPTAPDGGVLVNSGDGWRRLPTDQGVDVGDKVMVRGGAEGWLLYCGCDVRLKPGQIYNVESRDCPVYGVRYGEGLPHTLMTQPLEEEEIRQCGTPVAWWLLGGAAAVGGGVGACVAADCFDDDDGDDRQRPASP